MHLAVLRKNIFLHPPMIRGKGLIFAVLVMMWLLTRPACAEILVGRVVDAQTGEPLSEVTITHKEVDGAGRFSQKRLAYLSTDSLGHFSVYGLEGMNTLTFSLIGYKDISKSRVCSGKGRDTIKLGDIKLKLSDVLLKGAGIKARRRLFYMHGDTVVYNPKAFDLREGDRIERLLRKLPGVTVEADGRLLWMGKPIRMIMNGQTNDVAVSFLPQLAAEAVDNVKVYDKTSPNERRKGRKGEKVLDVKIKKEWMEKWYGNVSLTGEQGGYYNVNANGYHLSDNIPVYTYFNLGDGGHTYIPGSPAFVSQIHKENDAEIRQLALGLRGDYKIPLDSSGFFCWRFIVTPDMSHSDRISSSFSKRENYLSDNKTNYSVSSAKDYDHSLKINPISFSGNYITDKISVNYDLDISYSKEENHSSDAYILLTSSPYDLTADPLRHINDADSLGNTLRRIASSNSKSEKKSLTDMVSIRPSVSFSRNIKSRGTIYSSFGFNYSGQKTRTYSLNDIRYYSSSSQSNVDKQHSTEPAHNLSGDFSLSYGYSFSNGRKSKRTGKWLNNNTHLDISYKLGYSQQYSNRNLYRWIMSELPEEDHMHSLFFIPQDKSERDSALDRINSVRSDLQTIDNTGKVSIDKSLNKFSVNLSAEINNKNERLEYRRGTLDTIAKRTKLRPLLSLRMEYKLSKAAKLRFTLDSKRQPPSIYRIMPYVDNSDQTRIYLGNPHLKDQRQDNATLRLNTVLTRLQLMMEAQLKYHRLHHDISTYEWYDSSTGVYTHMPMNIRGGHSWDFEWSVEKLIAARWRIKNNANAYWHQSYDYLTEDVRNPQSVINSQRNRIFSDEIQLTYSGVDIDAKLYGDITNRHWNNSRGINAKYNYWDYLFGAEGKYRFLRDLEVELDASWNKRTGYMSDIMNKNTFLMDMALSWYVFRSRGTLTVGGRDLFDNYSTRDFSVSPSSRYESSRFSIHHYYYLKFTYNFDGRPKQEQPALRGL